ncbi:MAG TPA: hypothetical protein VFY84_09435, partial [Jiangellales bacterium]|nr:hypothetical protein [Jiangellales bacterium]
VVATTVAMGAGAALASIPDSGGVIHGCYGRTNGKLRVIDTNAGGKCKPGEVALNWNQTGPAGPVGPPGPAGAPATAVSIAAKYNAQQAGEDHLAADGITWESELLPPGWEGVISVSAWSVARRSGYWVCYYGYRIGNVKSYVQTRWTDAGISALPLAGAIGIPSASSGPGRLWVNCKPNLAGTYPDPHIAALEIAGYIMEVQVD